MLGYSRYCAIILSCILVQLLATTLATAATGRTAGTFGVSATGAATYQIPIWVPPGTKGIQPNLALTYNSHGGDGTMGPGWSLSGLSSITRCNATYAQDTVSAPVTLTYNDKFCLNGNRLRLTSGAYGYAGSVYQTEIADFSKVTAFGVMGNGPEYFIVQGKDGLTYEYGNTPDSRVAATLTSTAYAWTLNKVSDRQGNTMVVTYSQSDGSFVPVSIQYSKTVSGSTSFSYEVTLTYVTRSAPDAQNLYVAGGEIHKTRHITTIEVRSGGTPVRRYNLSYNPSPTTGLQRLSSIQECTDSSGSNCLAATNIAYQNGTVGVAAPTTSIATGGLSPSSVYTISADVDGDGRKDLVYMDTSQFWVQFATSTGFGNPINTGATYNSAYRLPVLDDFDGDGKLELLSAVSGNWYAYRWNGSSFSSTPIGISVDANIAGTLYAFASADVDGDGLPDLISLRTDGKVYQRLNTSSGGTISLSTTVTPVFDLIAAFGATSNWQIMGNNSPQLNHTTLKHQDFNGDGRQDLIVNLNVGQVSTWRAILPTAAGYMADNFLSLPGLLPIDWNGDSCTDGTHGYHGASTPIYVLISACNGGADADVVGFYGPGVGGGSSSYTAYNTAMDWDGDGRMDLIAANSAGLVSVIRSLGDSAATKVSTGLTVGTGKLYPLDKDGDDLDDLLFVNYNTSPYTITFGLHNGANVKPDLLTSITDGFGVAHNPTYVSIVQSNYTKGSGATYPEKDIQTPMYVVSQVTASDGISASGTYARTLSYTGARQNLQGRGFAGFQSRTVTDSRTNAPKETTYYKTAFPYAGTVYQQDVFQNNGTTLISRTINTPAVLNLDTTANNQRYFPYVSLTTKDTYEVGGSKNGQLVTTATASFAYDNYGNVTSSTQTVTDKDSASPQSPTYNQVWTKVVTSTLSPNTTNWCLGIPTQTAVQQSATGVSAITRTTSYTPDYVNCRITQSIVEPGSSSHKVTTGYGYDAFGNVNSQTVTGINMTARTTTTNWGTTGQFPINTTNAEGHYTQAGYNYNLGVQTSITDPNNLTTSWTHDGFGRKLTETRPDGTSTAYSYNDCATVSGGCQNGDPIGATGINKMVVIATAKDTGGTALRDEWTYLDQFDRTIVTKSKTLTGGYSRVGAQYNALGQLYRQTAPCNAASCSVYWTTNTYDALGRLTAQSRPISASNGTLQTTSISYQGMSTVTTDPQSKATTKITDPNGWLRRSSDHNGYYQNFTYDAFGSLKTVVDSSSNALFSANYVYGIDAFQTATTDMDLGTWGYTPNALGEVVAYTDAKASAFNLTYDKLSRIRTRYVSGEGTATWTWGTTASQYEIGQLESVTSTGGTTETYTYDNKGRLSQKAITADGTTYNYNYAYNSSTGLLDTMTYPTSTSSYRLALKYLYQNGLLQQVKDNNASTIFWQANAMNSRGQVTQETLGNGIVTNRSFDAVTGWVNSIQSGIGGGTGVQNEAYLFDKVGNVTQRQNNTLGLTESFYYDNLYRLDYSQLNSVTNLDMTYDALGRITNRSDVARGAAWTYHATKKHAVTEAGNSSFTYTYDANGNAITRNGQSITWSKYNYPTVINDATGENVTISYDASHARWKQVYWPLGTLPETTLYLGDLLEKVTTGSTTDWRHYIHANGRATVAVMSRLSTGTNTTRYVLEDHQDSPSKITDGSGATYVSESFTAFGNRRNPSTWSDSPTSGDLTNINNVSRQGYTWQTALGNMGLNHMNGRVQDAITGRFLSADPYITEPGNTQNYNRYSYVYNNPLSFTDPSGFCREENSASPQADTWCEGNYTGGPGDGSGPNTSEDYRGPGTPVDAAGSNGDGTYIHNANDNGIWLWWSREDSPYSHFHDGNPSAGFLFGDSDFGWTGGTNGGGNPASSPSAQQVPERAPAPTWGSYIPGTTAGDSAAQFWADRHVQTGNSLYAVPGFFASLWTPDTAIATSLTLFSGASALEFGPAGSVFGRAKVGGSSLFGINSNSVLRIGWGWKGTSTAGVNVFRISGSFVKRVGVESGHIDLFTLAPK